MSGHRRRGCLRPARAAGLSMTARSTEGGPRMSGDAQHAGCACNGRRPQRATPPGPRAPFDAVGGRGPVVACDCPHPTPCRRRGELRDRPPAARAPPDGRARYLLSASGPSWLGVAAPTCLQGRGELRDQPPPGPQPALLPGEVPPQAPARGQAALGRPRSIAAGTTKGDMSMTDGTQSNGEAGAGRDPWAPPESGPSLEKSASPGAGQSATPQPPSVHDQGTRPCQTPTAIPAPTATRHTVCPAPYRPRR